MELTNKYKRPTNFTSLRNQVKESLLGFISQRSAVFEGLARQSTPFGDNWLRGSRTAAKVNASQSPRELMDSIQQQLGTLTGQVAQLNNQINSTQSATDLVDKNRVLSVSPVNPIGIHRFRALRAKLHESA